MVIISSLSASLLNLTVSNDPITACCIEIIVKNKANGIIFYFIWWVFCELKVFECWNVFDWIWADESSFYKSEESDNGKWWCRRMWEWHDFIRFGTIPIIETRIREKYAYKVTRAYLGPQVCDCQVCIGWLWMTVVFRRL